VAVAAVCALVYAVAMVDNGPAGAWGWAALTAVGLAVAMATPLAIVFARREHRLVLEEPVLLPAALLLAAPLAIGAAAVGVALGTAWRLRAEQRHTDLVSTTARTTGTYVASVAAMHAVGRAVEPATVMALFLTALLLGAVHLAVVLPVPLLRAGANPVPGDTSLWRQLAPALSVAPLAAVTGGAAVVLLDLHGPLGLAVYAPVAIAWLGGRQLTRTQRDHRRLDALYGLAVDTAATDDTHAAEQAAVAAARSVFAGAEVEVRDQRGDDREASVHLGDGRWLVASRGADPFSDDDRDLLAAVGRLTEVAMQRAELREAAALQEQVKTALLAAVGHDLQDPLTVQRGLAETLAVHADRLDVERTRDIASRLASTARRMSRTVAGLVDLERAELGGAPHEDGCEPVAALREWADELELARGQWLRVTLPDGDGGDHVSLPTVYLEHIVENLVRNACRYSPPDTPVDLRVERHASELSITVEDRGPGLPADPARLFEALTQADGPSQGSAGLGLFITSRLTAHGGGRLEAASREGGGARFIVTLPLQPAPGREHDATPSPEQRARR
jgi:signal transduction histidine kinase